MRNAAHLRKAITNGGGNYSDEFYTPEPFHKPLGLFHFDPFAGPVSRIAIDNWREPVGFSRPWPKDERGFIQPPYSDNMKEEALRLCARHRFCTALVPAATDTGWCQNAMGEADALLFLKGRINFKRPKKHIAYKGKDGVSHPHIIRHWLRFAPPPSKSANPGPSLYLAYGEHDAKMLKRAWERAELPGQYIEITRGHGKPYGGLFAP